MNLHQSSFHLPDLIEIQRKSFFSFLEKGLTEEFELWNSKKSLKTKNQNFTITWVPNSIRFQKPAFSISDSIFEKRTYASKV